MSPPADHAVERATGRLASIDILRGLVMVIMALDHTRDLFSNATFDPTDLTHTTPALFLTRWITHFCAPVFVLLAGTGIFLSAAGGKSPPAMSRFLLTRGLWLIFLEIFVVTPLGWSFNWDFSFVRLQVIWVIGASMVILAGLVPVVPRRWVGAIGLIMILSHNLFDGAHAACLGAFAPAWRMLHSITPLRPFPHVMLVSLYPLVPWLGVMMLGYGAGDIVLAPARTRTRVLLACGAVMIVMFVVLRGLNLYGDPRPWTPQKNGVFDVLAVLNCLKYPPSLAYLLMTLGPAMLVLAMADRLPKVLAGPLATFGRVPLFYYLLHLPLLHALAVAFSVLRYGQAPWLFHDMMAQHGAAHPLPSGYGYELWVVYAVWIGVVAALYPVCRWYAGVKARSRNPLLSYL